FRYEIDPAFGKLLFRNQRKKEAEHPESNAQSVWILSEDFQAKLRKVRQQKHLCKRKRRQGELLESTRYGSHVQPRPLKMQIRCQNHSCLWGLKLRAREFIQNRWCVGGGPSGKRCPRWEPHLAQSTSVRTIP